MDNLEKLLLHLPAAAVQVWMTGLGAAVVRLLDFPEACF